jgi:hypothetical protein
MNSTLTVRLTAVAATLLAALVLTACGGGTPRVATDGTAPAAQSRPLPVADAGNPREHLAYRDLAAADGSDGNPFEHLAHRGAADDAASR